MPNPVFPMVSGGNVGEVYMVPGPGLLGTALGSKSLILRFRRYSASPDILRREPVHHIQHEHHCSRNTIADCDVLQRGCWYSWRAALKRSAVLTRPSKLMTATSVGVYTIGDTLLTDSGCLAALNVNFIDLQNNRHPSQHTVGKSIKLPADACGLLPVSPPKEHHNRCTFCRHSGNPRTCDSGSVIDS
jgi:hypothetical protein